MVTRKRIFELIDLERKRQNMKWGQQSHTKEHWFIILSEEIGEIAKAIYERDLGYEMELIQSASVLVAMLEDSYNGGTLDEDNLLDRELTKPESNRNS
jgi:predicted house-cleaning noncanonical NTP pyrophosphatase (MazG superfamily)